MTSLADLRGRRIAYSPGQAQGALVLRVLRAGRADQGRRRAGGAGQHRRRLPDRASQRRRSTSPRSAGCQIRRYLANYGPDGASTIPHGLRDDPGHLYAPTTVSPTRPRRRPIREYVAALGTRHDLGLRTPGGVDRALLRPGPGPDRRGRAVAGRERPASRTSRPSWTETIARHQETIDLLAEETGNGRCAAEDLYDRRYESVGADAIRTRGDDALDRRRSASPCGRRATATARSTAGPPATAARPGPADPVRRALLGPLLLLARVGRRLRDRAARPRILSAPWTVVDHRRRADRRRPPARTAWPISAQRAGLGLALGIVLGAVLALVAGLSRWGEALIDGPIQIKRAIPALALMPLLILWLGIGEADEGRHHHARRLRPDLHPHPQRAAHASTAGTSSWPRPSGCGRAAFIRRVVLPGALPGFLLGAAVRGRPAPGCPWSWSSRSTPPAASAT